MKKNSKKALFLSPQKRPVLARFFVILNFCPKNWSLFYEPQKQ